MTTLNQLNQGWRHAVLAGVAAVALGMSPPALAQQQGGSGQAQGGQGQTPQAQSSASPNQQPAIVGQIRTAEQALRQAMGQVSGGQQPNWAQARTAVESGLTVLGRAPQQIQGEGVWRTAQRELNEAQQALQVSQPNQQQATNQMREAADALGTLAGRIGGSTDSSNSTSSGTTAAPTPSQSGGSQPQQAAVASSGGMALQSVQDMVGKNVVGSNGRDAGEVQNLLIDKAGRVRAAVIEWGGFLGIGDRQALVPIDRLQLSQGGNDRARLNMTREELEALPRYDRDHVADYGRQQGWGDGLRLYR
ncbi:PRC-barrel domain-containing protein [Falsiroseomonas sp. HW251]|uniref:PRC-barrel domain-containing protein n=1 Tax=Falsiroseomonas sp. HW251 TaxID=3390998 RepID=UPI003D319FEE